MNKCLICGAMMAASIPGFNAHNKRFHGGVTLPIPHREIVVQSSGGVLELHSSVSGEKIGDGSTGMNGTRVVMPTARTRPLDTLVRDIEWGIMGYGKATIFPDSRPVKC